MSSGPTIAVVQARMTSSRLPGKALLELAGVPMLGRVVERLERIQGIDSIVVAAPEGAAHDPIADYAEGLAGVGLVRGSEDNVLERTANAVRATDAETVMRVTSDCPMIDPDISGAVLASYQSSGVTYARLAFEHGFPLGFDTEVFSAEALLIAEREAEDPYELEHATPFIWRRPERFPATYLDHYPDRRQLRLVVDTPEDFRFAEAVYNEFYPEIPDFRLVDLISLFDRRPELLAINRDIPQTPFVDAPEQR